MQIKQFFRSHQRMNVNTISESDSKNDENTTMTPGEMTRANHRRYEVRFTKMVLLIFITFVLSQLPLTIIKIVDKNTEIPVLHILGDIFLYGSVCTNNLIYFIMNKQYQEAYKKVLNKICWFGEQNYSRNLA